MKKNSILIAEKRKVFRLNTALDKIEWEVSFENIILELQESMNLYLSPLLVIGEKNIPVY